MKTLAQNIGKQSLFTLLHRINAHVDIDAVYYDLIKHYSEKHRKYHTLKHVKQCLKEFKQVKNLAINANSIEFAIWYHDLIYDTKGRDNEEKSANAAKKIIEKALLPDSFKQSVVNLILATKHSIHLNKNPDIQLLMDIDLSILGQPKDIFDKYENQIRKEYQWVPEKVFVAERSKILKHFLNRPTIYQTSFFRNKYEVQARKNIINAISSYPKPEVIVVLGPTATGKSDLAVQLAKKFSAKGGSAFGGNGAEIVSADSRQIYKGMNLGTGKITEKEMRGVEHHMLNIIKPNTIFSVSKYKKLAEYEIEKIIKRGKLPIICGGTGFYIDSIVKNISLPEVLPNKKLRATLEKKSTEKLYEMLKKLSPSRAKNIDKYNKVRLIRAIEIAKALGNVPEVKELPSPYHFVLIGLDMPDEELKRRVGIRLLARISAGMTQEVQKLHKQGVSWKRLESFGLEYREVALYLQKKITKDQMLENLKSDIWHYVKRQRTWFKRNHDIKWFRPRQASQIIKQVKNFIRKN